MDRSIRGLLAGVAGAIIMNIWDFVSFYILKFSNLLYLDWAAIMIYGDKPANTLEYYFSLLTQIGWSGFLGIIFAFSIPYITSRNFLIKGGFYGFISTFIIYAIPVLFKIPHLKDISSTTAISHSIGATAWGIVTAQVLYWLDLPPKVG